MRPIAIVLVLALAACQMPVSIDTPPLVPVLNVSGKAIDVEGSADVEVRTFLNVGEKRVWLEDLIGARCTLESRYFNALTFQSPQKLQLPALEDNTPHAKVTCSYNGETLSRAMTCYKMRGKNTNCQFADVSLIFAR